MKNLFTNCFCFVAVGLALTTGCTSRHGSLPLGEGGEKGSLTQPQDTVYTQQAAMAIYDYDPVRALLIIDSAVIVGNLSDWWADENRARIYSQTRAGERLDSLMHWTADARFDSAKAIGERLLRHDSIKNSLTEQQNVLEILAYTARQQQDSTVWLQRSRQLVEVCRQQGAETEALRNEAEVGAALCSMGRQTEGMAMLDSVISALELSLPQEDKRETGSNFSLLRGDKSGAFNELDALVIALKRKIGVMTIAGQSAEILPLARRIVTLTDDYAQHPDQYHDGTYREPPADKREDYIRFYRSQAQNYIAAAYAALGQADDMKATFERLENIVREAETREHHARYAALELKMQRQEAEARADRNQLIAIGTGTLLLLALIAQLVYWRQKRIINRKNCVLAHQLTELYDNTRPKTIEHSTLSTEYSDTQMTADSNNVQCSTLNVQSESMSPEDLYRYIRDEVIRLQLYTDPGFGRQSVIKHFHLAKDVASRVFSQGSEHSSISDFITECRLDHARRLLVSRPDMSIADIAAASGFGLRTTFTRSFKNKHGLTPTEFREQQR